MTRINGKKIFITGVSGFLGSYTAAAFLSEGAEVYGLIRPGSMERAICRMKELSGREELSHFHAVSGCIEDIGSLEGLPEHIDCFLHFAWGGVNRREIDEEDIHRRNAEASLGLVRLAASLGAELFMDAGSRVEYGIKADGIMEESMDCDPINAYGRNKLKFYKEARDLCGRLGMGYIHLRYFSVYGKGDHPWSIISTLTRELPKGEKVALSACRHRWNFMEVRDAARAVVLLYKNRSGSGSSMEGYDIVNIASEDTRVLREFTEEIHKLSGGKGELCYGEFIQAKEGPLSICPVTERLKLLTNGEFREEITFSQGISELIEYNLNQDRT